MLNVNDVRKSVLKVGSLTAVVGTGTVYNGAMNRYARKRELNIVVTAYTDKQIMIRQVPLFDSVDLDMMKTDALTNKYLHIGCVTMSIEPLMHQRFLKDYGSGIRGYCLLVDATFKKLDESIIAAYRYDLKGGRADYVCFPNHCLSLSDPNIQRRLSILVGFDNIDVDPGTELFNLCIGYIITGVNTLNPTGSKGIKSFPISGASDLDVTGLLQNGEIDMSRAYNRCDLITHPSDDDIYIQSKGSFLSNLMGTTKVIKRRTMRVMEAQDGQEREHNKKVIPSRLTRDPKGIRVGHHMQSEKDTTDKVEGHRRSTSEGISEEDLYAILNKRAVVARTCSMPRKQSY